MLLHGDAAFAGQGIVMETLQLASLRGYRTGGTIHIVINNQIGFTTSPEASRSSIYSTDAAQITQTPIFHINGDDPEAAYRVTQIALDYRQEYNKDVVPTSSLPPAWPTRATNRATRSADVCPRQGSSGRTAPVR